MKSILHTTAAAAVLIAGTAGLQAKELRIGFISTFTGGAAIVGKHQKFGWMLGLEHEGWKKSGDKLGGVPTKITFGDDQRKVDVGLNVAQKMIKSDRVHIIAGVIWSNVIAVVSRAASRAKRIVISTSAGPSTLAGRGCSRYFIATTQQNDQAPEAMGLLMRREGLKRVFLFSPNYQAGKDMLKGFRRYYKGGKIVGQILYKLGTRDFNAEISRIRAAKPDAVFAFAPGGMGIALIKQWAASGINKTIKLYEVFSVTWLTLKPIGKAAVGTYTTHFWRSDSKLPANQRFWKAYISKHKSPPSIYAMATYDAARLIAAALRKQGGFDGDTLKLAKTLRKVKYDSVRGPYTYNVNGMPIQDFYKREVVLGKNGKPDIVSRQRVMKNHKDSYWHLCPASERH